MKIPIVSILIPTYNREKKLHRALTSVLSQSFSNFEVIIIDDGSSCDLNKYISNIGDYRIRYIRHAQRMGGSAARNTGIRNASGELLAFLDDDDEWLPTKLEKQIAKYVENEGKFKIIYTGYNSVDESSSNTRFSVLPTRRGDVFIPMLSSCILAQSTVLVEKKCFDKIGLYDESLPACQDRDIFLRLSRHFLFDFVPEALVKKYFHKAEIVSISNNATCRMRGLELTIIKYYSDYRKYPRLLGKQYYNLGYLKIIARKYSEARLCFLFAIRFRERWLNSILHIVLSLFTPSLHSRLLSRRRVIT